MKPFNTWSIRSKLIVLALASATVAVAITGISMVRKEISDLRVAKVERLSSQARMVAFNSSGVLTFLDNKAAEKLLQSLEAEPTIEVACLYDAEGILFASYVAEGMNITPPTSFRGSHSCKYDSKGTLEISESIDDQQNHLGTVLLRANSSDISKKVHAGLYTILTVAMLSLTTTGIISYYLQKSISNPVIDLLNTAKAITCSSDYSLRVEIVSGDELGQLSEAFNKMLSQVEASKQQLTDAHGKLEERVLQRTEELSAEIAQRKQTQKDLEVSIVAAEAANRTKSKFLANMSHEIRTPLNGILGFTEILVQGRGSISADERNEHLCTIRKSGQHLLSLINDILDLSKIEADQLHVEVIPCSPHDIISEIVSVLRVSAQEKGIGLDYRWESSVPKAIQSDPYRLKQILLNLVGNAIKFTDQGAVLMVAFIDYEAPTPELVIEVRDTGIGISQDKLVAVFQPFVQADDSVTRQFGGTGLGLTISRKIAAALKGSLTVSSIAGKGSTFVVRIATGDLSGVEVFDPTKQLAGADIRDNTLSVCDVSGLRALVADDGDTNRKLLRLLLERGGAKVCIAENGQVAVDLAKSNTFDVILMDMQMPILDGYAATAELREQGYEGPIIALTAHAMKGDREKCERAGCSGYLSKPINTDRLFQALAELTATQREMEQYNEMPTEHMPEKASGPINSLLPTDDEELREIVEQFFDTLESKLSEMTVAWNDGNCAELSELAHWLKGSGGTVGFDCFTSPAQILDQFAREENLPGIESTLKQLRGLQHRLVL